MALTALQTQETRGTVVNFSYAGSVRVLSEELYDASSHGTLVFEQVCRPRLSTTVVNGYGTLRNVTLNDRQHPIGFGARIGRQVPSRSLFV